MGELIYQEEAYRIIGACLEVHRELGRGHSEAIYRDALEIELGRQQISVSREAQYAVAYKGTVLPHKYFADFVAMDKIIIEVKAVEGLTSSHIRQVLNYLAASRLKLGLLVNFGEDSLTWKRVVL